MQCTLKKSDVGDRMTDSKRIEQAKMIAEMINKDEYKHYGIRVLLPDEHYSEGDIARVSHKGGLKENGSDLDTGTYTILVPAYPGIDDIIETIDRARMYGKRLALLGCLEGKGGYDLDEICMKNATVLIII
jgi:hypothetical protein